ncbi:MAG: hypothetical protein ACRCYT_09595 [Cetobacterium sp.]
MASEKELKSYGEQFVRSSAPQQNVSVNAAGTYTIQSLPTMKYYDDNYQKDYSMALRAVYKLGRGMIEAHNRVTTENETIRLNNEYIKLRSEFTEKWDNPNEINLSSEKWREERKKAFEELQGKENTLLSESKLTDRDIDIFSARNSKYYKESEIEFDFKIGDFERKKNIATYATTIENSILLMGNAKNRAEQEQYLASINSAKSGLMKYDVLETDIDKSILNGFENLVRKNNITNLNKIFRGATTENYQGAAKEAQGYVTTNFNSAMGLLAGIDGFKDRDAGKVAQTLLENSMEEARSYISDKVEAYEYKKQMTASKELDKREKELNKQQQFYNRDEDLKAGGDVPKLLVHRSGFVGEVDIKDMAYNESFEKPLSDKIFGENFTLEKQGQQGNYAIGDFINDGYFSGAGGIKEQIRRIEELGGGEKEVLQYAQATARELLGDTGDYQVSPEKKKAVLDGATKEILFKSGINPKIMDGNIDSNLKAVEYFKSSNKFDGVQSFYEYDNNTLEDARSFWTSKATPLEEAIRKTKEALLKDNGAKLQLDSALLEKRAREIVMGRIIERGKDYGFNFNEFIKLEEKKKIQNYNKILEKDTFFDDERNLKNLADGTYNMYVDGDQYKRKKIIPYKDVK